MKPSAIWGQDQWFRHHTERRSATLAPSPVRMAKMMVCVSRPNSASAIPDLRQASDHPQSYQVHPQLQAANIRRWAESTQAYSSTQTYSTQLYPPTPPSPTGSTGSNWSETTARGRANADATYRGDWVTMPPVGRRAAAY